MSSAPTNTVPTPAEQAEKLSSLREQLQRIDALCDRIDAAATLLSSPHPAKV